jgi:hypothetical protein
MHLSFPTPTKAGTRRQSLLFSLPIFTRHFPKFPSKRDLKPSSAFSIPPSTIYSARLSLPFQFDTSSRRPPIPYPSCHRAHPLVISVLLRSFIHFRVTFDIDGWAHSFHSNNQFDTCPTFDFLIPRFPRTPLVISNS